MLGVGMDDYLQKPLTSASLGAVLQLWGLQSISSNDVSLICESLRWRLRELEVVNES